MSIVEEQSIFDMFETSNPQTQQTLSKLDLHQAEEAKVEKTSKEPTPEFKWGQQVSKATLPSQKEENTDNIFS